MIIFAGNDRSKIMAHERIGDIALRNGQIFFAVQHIKEAVRIRKKVFFFEISKIIFFKLHSRYYQFSLMISYLLCLIT